MLKSLFFVVPLAFMLVGLAAAGFPGEAHRQAHEILAQMSQEQKLHMLAGTGGAYVGVVSSPGLNIPTLNLEDGPQGVADGMRNVTAWPSALTVTCSFDTDLYTKFGQAMAQEQAIKGTNIMLGPMVNLGRVPEDGRIFESIGEDPVVGAAYARAVITGIQNGTGVMATVKHWVNNNQETNRTLYSATVNRRAQVELYFPAYVAAIEAGVGAVMCSYNRIDNWWACCNAQTLNSDLKDLLGFEGFVMSDWGATDHCTSLGSANGGLDMEMPGPNVFLNTTLQQLLDEGLIEQSTIDDKVVRILTASIAVGLFNSTNNGNPNNNALSSSHNELARQLAAESTVLLKNDNNLLPVCIIFFCIVLQLSIILIRTTLIIAIIIIAIITIFPSLHTSPTHPFVRSFVRSFVPLFLIQLDNQSNMIIAVIGDDATNPIVAGGGSGSVIPPYIITPLQGIQTALNSTQSTILYSSSSNLTQAQIYASKADVTVIFLSQTSSEGMDRNNLSLSYADDDLVFSLSSFSSSIVVFIHSTGPVFMPWADSVESILWGGMPGQEEGNAVADVLFGVVNPSARLPLTFPLDNDEWCCSSIDQWPGIGNEVNYSEDLLVGYRWFDAMDKTPLFPFGHGLSYSSFLYSSVSQSNYSFTLSIKNIGSVSGREVVQFYITYPASAGEPPFSLRFFSKTPTLAPGESVDVTYTANPSRDFSVFINDLWTPVSGQFILSVGASSRDIRQTLAFSYSY